MQQNRQDSFSYFSLKPYVVTLHLNPLVPTALLPLLEKQHVKITLSKCNIFSNKDFILKSSKVYGFISTVFNHLFAKGNKLSDFLLLSLDKVALPKWGLLLKERIHSKGREFFITYETEFDLFLVVVRKILSCPGAGTATQPVKSDVKTLNFRSDIILHHHEKHQMIFGKGCYAT